MTKNLRIYNKNNRIIEKNKLIFKSKKNSHINFGFSLIELSIVLIIIGLLVAGVVGGKSLIDSAKERALLNEARNYKQAFTTFIH